MWIVRFAVNLPAAEALLARPPSLPDTDLRRLPVVPHSADKPKAAPGNVLAPLKHPVFRNVWFASMASNFGGMIQ